MLDCFNDYITMGCVCLLFKIERGSDWEAQT